MSDRSSQQFGRGRTATIIDAVKVVVWIVAAFACTGALTHRLFPTSATVTPIVHARQIRHLPLKSLRGSFWWLRKLCFTRPRSLEPSVVVTESREAVTDLLSRNDFVPGWAVSYNYRDEILNCRRIEHLAHPSGLDWWQIHVRGYAHADGIELTAHFEPEPRRHPRAHITLSGLDIDRGMDALLELLDSHRVDYDWLDNPLNP